VAGVHFYTIREQKYIFIKNKIEKYKKTPNQVVEEATM